MQLKEITKTYGSNNVLDHIDFDFGHSQIVGLIGKNGVGKTTLMKVMNGNIVNYKGEVQLSNKENIGYLIEHPKLYDNKSGLYNLKLFANVLGKGFDKKYADQIIDAFGMRNYIKKKIKKYLTIIFTSVLTGVVLNFVLVFTTLKIFGYSKDTIVTLLPRSITAAVGIEVSQELGGTDTITVLFIITTGLIGSILGSMLLRMGGFKSSIARGLTYGNASHAFGTAKALELDIESGAFSSIGMILTAVISSVLIPVLILLFY